MFNIILNYSYLYDARQASLAQVQQHPVFILSTLSIIFFNFARDRDTGEGSESERVSPLPRRVIQSLRMLCYALVPDHDCTRFVAHSAGEIVASIDVIEKELEEIVYWNVSTYLQYAMQ